MAFGIHYDSLIYDSRDAVCGIRTRRVNDNTYETPALPAWIANAANQSDDVAAYVVDLATGKRVFVNSYCPQPPESDIPF